MVQEAEIKKKKKKTHKTEVNKTQQTKPNKNKHAEITQRQDAKEVRGDAGGSVDVLAAGVDYLRSLRLHDSYHGPVQKYTKQWAHGGGGSERSWRRTKITESRQERMGLESNVCAGGIFWT